MKVLKIILGIVVAVVVLLVVYVSMLPSAYKVERSIEINASSSMVMDHIANFKEWENWSPWKAKDATAKYTYEGPDYGVGSKMAWESSLPEGDPNSTGQGNMTIAELNGTESIKYDLQFIKPWESSSQGGFNLSTADNGSVTLTWYDSGELPWIMRPWGAMMDELIGADFEAGLANLKAHVEEHAMIEPKWPVEEVVVEALPYISVIDSCTVEEIGPKLAEMYGKLGAFCGTKQMAPVAPPICIYHTWDGKSTKMEAGFVMAEAADGEGDINSGMTYAGSALKVTYMGAYEQSGEAHESIDAYAAAQGKEVVGPPWEIYVTDPMEESDTSQWITEVYYPVK